MSDRPVFYHANDKPALLERKVSYLTDASPALTGDWKGPAQCPRCHRRGIYLECGTSVIFRHAAEQARVSENWPWVTCSAQECHIMDWEGLMERFRADELTAELRAMGPEEIDLDRMMDHDPMVHPDFASRNGQG